MYHRIRFILAALVCLVAMALAPSAVAAPQEYEFTKIADSAGRWDAFDFGCPALNNASFVAFRGTRSGETGIWISRGGRPVPIALEGEEFDFLGRNPSINDTNQVSFAARLDDGSEAILRGSGGPLTTIARTDPGAFNFFGFDTSINNAGEVAFKAELDTFDEGLFSGSGGPITTWYLGSTSPFQGTDTGPSINDVVQVAFQEDRDDFTSGIFRADAPGAFVTIADDSGPINGGFGLPSLNNRGRVAFRVFLDDLNDAIFVGNGGRLRRVVSTEGPFAFFGDPSLNDFNQVAFFATLDDFAQGLFTGPDPVQDRVIGTGDELFGATVTNLVLCREGLNNFGQLAFLAQLADERTVVARADPK